MPEKKTGSKKPVQALLHASSAQLLHRARKQFFSLWLFYF